jgi:hypothetical protein
VAGCGGAVAGAKGGEAAPRDADVDPAAELDRAEREISSLFGPAAGEPGAGAPATSPAILPASPPKPADDPRPAEAQSGGAAADERPAGDPCAVACRALASMERAANHLCGLSGEAQPPCTSARDRVKAANDRVAARCACK